MALEQRIESIKTPAVAPVVREKEPRRSMRDASVGSGRA